MEDKKTPKQAEESAENTDHHNKSMRSFEYVDNIKEKLNRFGEFIMKATEYAAKVYSVLEMIDWEKVERKWIDVAEKVGKSGWTIPLHISVVDLLDIADLEKQADIDQAFMKYFSEDDNFEEMKKNIMENALLTDFHELLEQCFSNYEKGQFLITIPSLFSILEGFAHKLIFSQYRQSPEYNEKSRVSLQRKYEKMRTDIENNTSELAFYASAALFLEKSFDNREAFNDEESKDVRPLIINRHRVLHGRDIPAMWKRHDAIRLFNAIHTLSVLDLTEENIS